MGGSTGKKLATVLTGPIGATITGGSGFGIGEGLKSVIGQKTSKQPSIDLPAVADVPPPIDATSITSAQEIVKKRRKGAIGVLERRGGIKGKSLSGLLKQSETRGGLLVG